MNALILVDVQYGFLHSEATEQMMTRLRQLVGERDRLFDRVVATKYVNASESNISRLMNWRKLRTAEEQTIPTELLERVDYVDEKSTYSGCTPTLWEYLVRENGGQPPEQVFLAGLELGCCVLATAMDFFESGVRPYVLTAYCSSAGGPEYYDAAILCLHHLIGRRHLIQEPELHTRAQLEQLTQWAKTPGRQTGP